MEKTLSQMLASSAPLACVVQGGGMRGAYSMAVLAELEEMGLTGRFSAIYGSSAGALNAAYFLASRAGEGVAMYLDQTGGRRLIDPTRIRPIIDIDYLVDEVLLRHGPLDGSAVLDSPTDLIVFATNATTGEGQRFHVKDRRVPLAELFRATAAVPIVFGREVEIDGERYCDGGLFDQAPLREAIDDGCENVLLVLTRPLDHVVTRVTLAERWFMRTLARVVGHSPGVVRLLGSERERMRWVMAVVSGKDPVPANVWVIAPTDGAVPASRLTRSKRRLLRTVEAARADTRTALGRGPVAAERP
jgi:predicted patatin/cPLA2 family phospholipase